MVEIIDQCLRSEVFCCLLRSHMLLRSIFHTSPVFQQPFLSVSWQFPGAWLLDHKSIGQSSHEVFRTISPTMDLLMLWLQFDRSWRHFREHSVVPGATLEE